jgi:hypothetical protein
VQVYIPGDTLELTKGEDLVRGWRHPDGGFAKFFCPECGAHLFSRHPEDPKWASVRMAAFDGDPGVRPSFRAYFNYAAPWDDVPDDGLTRFPEGIPDDARQ